MSGKTNMRFWRCASLPAVLLAAALTASAVDAANYYARTAGGGVTTNWNQNTTWTTDSDCNGAALGAGVFPGAADNVFICAGKTVNVTADAQALSVFFNIAGAGSTLQHNAGIKLTVGAGGVTINTSTNTNGTRTWNINAGIAEVNGNVSLEQNSASNNRIANITITTGSLDINGDLTMDVGNNTRARVTMSGGAGSLNLSGSFILANNLGTLTPGTTSTFTYDTGSTATVAAGAAVSYANLVIDKAGGSATAGTTGTLSARNVTVQNGTFTTDTADNVSVTVSLVVAAGALFDIASNGTVAITGTTTATGEVRISATGGGKTFTGDVTISALSGLWNNTGNVNVALAGNLDNDNTAGSFISGTGNYTCTNTRSFGGTGGGLTFDGNLVINGQRTNNTTVEVKGNLTGSNTFINAANRTLKIGGNANAISALTATAADNIVEYNGTGAQTMENTTYHHLVISNTTGPVRTNANTAIQGNFTNDGNYDGVVGSDTVTFNGSGPQAISGTATVSGSPTNLTTFYNLTVSNANGVTLTGTHNVTVTNTLTLTTGAVVTGANVLYVSRTPTGAIARTSGFVEGNLKWLIPTGTTFSRTFPVGTGTIYSPATMTFASVSDSGPAGSGITVSATSGDHPQIGTSSLNASLSVNRYWTLANSGTVLTTYDALFQYDTTDRDGGLTSGLLAVMRYDGAWNGATITDNQDSAATPTMEVSGEADFGAFAIGEVTGTGYSATLNRFNAYDPPNVTPANSVHGLIRTKIAGTAFTLTIAHLDAGVTAVQAFGTAETVLVELLDGTTSSGAFANNCWSSWTTVIASTTVNFTAAQLTATANFNVSNSWKNVRVRMTVTTSPPSETGCAGDAFAIRPQSFDLTASDGTSSTPGNTNTLNATAFNGTPVHKAGLPFSIRVNAAVPAGATNYYQVTAHAGSPTLKSAACAVPGGSASCLTCNFGTLALGAFSIVSSELNSTSTYSEAGVFGLTLEDKTYAAVDVADTSQATRTVPQTAAFSAGRFIPNDFLIEVFDALMPPLFQTFGTTDGLCTASAPTPKRSFTYVGQNFGYVLTREPKVKVTARNGLGSPTPTTNYQQCLWRLTAGGVTATPATTNPGKTLNFTQSSPSVAALDDNTGTGTVTLSGSDSYNYSRSTTTPDDPFQAAINIGISATDSDGVASNTFTFSSVAFDGGDFNTGAGLTGGKTFVFGRLRLSNASGSQLVSLAVPMETQYFSGAPANAFVTNAADQCTSILATNIELGTYTPNLDACETSLIAGTFTNGRATLLMSAPGATNNGSVILTARLESSVSGPTTCIGGSSTAVVGADKAFLQGNWTTSTYTQNPTARATFGVYRGTEEIIDIRENF